MLELFKKTLAAGLGAVMLTRDKAEELVEDLVEQGRISQEEAEEVIDELVIKAEKERDEIRNKVKEEFNNLLEKTNFKKKDEEISQLKKEVKNLSLEIEELRGEIKELKEKDKGEQGLESISKDD